MLASQEEHPEGVGEPFQKRPGGGAVAACARTSSSIAACICGLPACMFLKLFLSHLIQVNTLKIKLNYQESGLYD